MEVSAGQRIAGHKLLNRLAEGHYGEVWRAEYMGQTVVLKIFTRYYKINRDSLQREVFAQYALGRLHGAEQKHFPRVEHVDMDHQPPWMRMEMIDGKPLDQVVEDPRLSLQDRLSLGLEILQALAIIHKHDFVHGDMSPMNIIITEEAVKLIDVGFGAVLDENQYRGQRPIRGLRLPGGLDDAASCTKGRLNFLYSTEVVPP